MGKASRRKEAQRLARTPAAQAAARPLELLAAFDGRYPQARTAYGRFLGMRGTEIPDWPRWCYCPLAAAYAVISGGGSRQVPLERVEEIAVLGALQAWRPGKGVYVLDPDLAEALARTELGDRVPSGTLLRLPEWGMYVRAPGLRLGEEEIQGFLCHLEWDVGAERPELRVVLDLGGRTLLGIPLYLDQPTIGEALAQMLHTADRHAELAGAEREAAELSDASRALVLAAVLEPVVGVLLYLCSAEPDLREVPLPPEPGRRGGAPLAGPRVWEVGARIGAAIREARAQEEAERASPASGPGQRHGPRPHHRRAHRQNGRASRKERK